MIVSSNLTAEPRCWPHFVEATRQRGVHCIMSFQLYTFPAQPRGGTGDRGALNLFSRNRYQFTAEEQAIGAMSATHAATALIAAARGTQFESAARQLRRPRTSQRHPDATLQDRIGRRYRPVGRLAAYRRIAVPDFFWDGRCATES
jgi:hypothetical protein